MKNMAQRINDVKQTLQEVELNYSKPCFSCAFSAESIVLLDLIISTCERVEIFTIDTGRLHDSTYNLMAKIREKYDTKIITYFPEARLLEQHVNCVGHNAFYSSLENRKSCCFVRKVEPLGRALIGKDAWITGLRRQQSKHRKSLLASEWNEDYQLQKINPLLDWSYSDVWEYINYFNLPFNTLYDQGYVSIGCSPCTRAVTVGEDERAGRWWWEQSDVKECGLHIQPMKRQLA